MNSNKSKTSCNEGFTLIELLVVVLIIGILAAVAVPQYQKTIERSKATEAMTLLSSIVKAHQTYYLANGKYATKFEQLDVDIPFTGKTNFYYLAKDTKSNKDWSFEIEHNNNNDILHVARINGKYKGAGFFFIARPQDSGLKDQIICFERKKSGTKIVFDKTLPSGAYCERVMQGTFYGDNDYTRTYTLP